MLRLAILLSVQALLLSGCTLVERPAEQPPAASPPGESRATGPAEDSRASAVPGSTGPGRFRSAEPLRPEDAGIVTGTLGFDAVEAGCGYLETADGKRYEVIYPDGWRLDRATGHLLGPDGQDVRPGDVVSIRGSIATGMASICQLGPIFRATEVLSAGG